VIDRIEAVDLLYAVDLYAVSFSAPYPPPPRPVETLRIYGRAASVHDVLQTAPLAPWISVIAAAAVQIGVLIGPTWI